MKSIDAVLIPHKYIGPSRNIGRFGHVNSGDILKMTEFETKYVADDPNYKKMDGSEAIATSEAAAQVVDDVAEKRAEMRAELTKTCKKKSDLIAKAKELGLTIEGVPSNDSLTEMILDAILK